jgi:hypothetical protein
VTEPPLPVVLRRLIGGYQVTQALHVAAVLGIADLLADGPGSSDDLAEAADAHPQSLYRLLRALASIGVLSEDGGRRFSLTPLGECLRSDAPEPLAGLAAHVGRPYFWQTWSELLHSVRTGENAFRHVHGTDVMLVAPGGRERTIDEFAELFARAGFELVRAVPSESGVSVVEWAPLERA